MKRDYASGVEESADFFVGVEVEKTPMEGELTLFVVGLQRIISIEWQLSELPGCNHIFFGANHSFSPGEDWDQWSEWTKMIDHFLNKGIYCSLDIPLDHAEDFLETILVEQENFIPQIRVPLPYIKQWGYNTMVKIDDKGFESTNPGVWCHHLHDLMDRNRFTDWQKYKKDRKL